MHHRQQRALLHSCTMLPICCLFAVDTHTPSTPEHGAICNLLLSKHMRAGDTTKATDPYFPFEDAVDVCE
jgi:hypothetical protein